MSGKEKSTILKWDVISRVLFQSYWDSPFFVFTASNEKTVFGRIHSRTNTGSLSIWADVHFGNTLMNVELTISISDHAIARQSKMSDQSYQSNHSSILSFDINVFRSFPVDGTIVAIQVELKEVNEEKLKNSICESLQSVKESKVDSIYEKLLFDESIHDMQLIVGEKQYPAHKAILAANSPVFHRMFSHQMKETLSKKVEIKEMEPEVLEELLRYMYIKKVDKFENLASKLFIAADRYGMEEFKYICERELIKSLNVENVLQSIILAEKYNAVELKKRSINIIMSNFTQLCEKDEFKQFIKSHPNFLLELNQEMAAKCEIKIKK